MQTTVLTDIHFSVDMPQLMKRLRVEPNGEDAAQVADLARSAEDIAKPKAMYRPAFVESRDDEHIVVEGVKFTSRVLRVNLDQVQRVFPYVATCGTELEGWSSAIDDVLLRYWADAIREQALHAAMQALEADMTEAYMLGATARMNPGSLADWPISQQKPLFALLGNPREQIGVQLTDSYLMLPIKSVSGVRFPTEVTFESCQLCPREVCPGRRAAYAPGLFERRYGRSGA